MKNKYTPEQQTEALKFFDQGFTGPEISSVLNIKLGTLYRWKSEELRRKVQDPTSKTFEGINELDEDLRRKDATIEDLRSRVEVLEKYINKLKRDEESTRSYEEPVKGWKPPKR